MKLQGKIVFAGVLVSGGLLSCGQSKSTSELHDVGSDIHTGRERLYWVDGQDLVSGQCEPGKPLLRSYCQADLKKRSLANAKAAVYGSSKEKRDRLVQDAQELTGQLAAIDQALAQDPTNVDLSNERERVARSLRTTNDGLAGIDQYVRKVDDLFAKITTGSISYRISATGDNYPDLKPLMQSLVHFFNQVPPVQPAGQWQDTTTQRNFAAIKELSTWSAANSYCQQITPGTWIAVKGFVGTGVCSDDMALGKRLVNSSLMAVIPNISVAASITEKVNHLFWSRCFYDQGNPIAVGANDKGEIKSLGQPSNKLLPVVCEKIK